VVIVVQTLGKQHFPVHRRHHVKKTNTRRLPGQSIGIPDKNRQEKSIKKLRKWLYDAASGGLFIRSSLAALCVEFLPRKNS
jgi:hypothetical protein